MTDDRVGTHFYGDGHDHGDPPASFVNDIDSPPDIKDLTKGRDPRHALYIGAVWGIGMKYGIPLHPVVDEDGDYTDELRLLIGDNITITFVIPPPPDDWKISDWLGPDVE